MNSDAIAAVIAAMLQANGIDFKFKGEGSGLRGESGQLDWRYVEVVVIHPTTGKKWVLESLQRAAQFLRSVEQQR